MRIKMHHSKSGDTIHINHENGKITRYKVTPSGFSNPDDGIDNSMIGKDVKEITNELRKKGYWKPAGQER